MRFNQKILSATDSVLKLVKNRGLRIAVCSGKGGTGKSTVAVYLGIALQNVLQTLIRNSANQRLRSKKIRTVIGDFDLGAPNDNILLGELTPAKTLDLALKGKITDLSKITIGTRHDVELISGTDTDTSSIDPEQLWNLKTDIESFAGTDVFIIDLKAGTELFISTPAITADIILIVTNAVDTAIADAVKMINSLLLMPRILVEKDESIQRIRDKDQREKIAEKTFRALREHILGRIRIVYNQVNSAETLQEENVKLTKGLQAATGIKDINCSPAATAKKYPGTLHLLPYYTIPFAKEAIDRATNDHIPLISPLSADRSHPAKLVRDSFYALAKELLGVRRVEEKAMVRILKWALAKIEAKE